MLRQTEDAGCPASARTCPFSQNRTKADISGHLSVAAGGCCPRNIRQMSSFFRRMSWFCPLLSPLETGCWNAAAGPGKFSLLHFDAIWCISEGNAGLGTFPGLMVPDEGRGWKGPTVSRQGPVSGDSAQRLRGSRPRGKGGGEGDGPGTKPPELQRCRGARKVADRPRLLYLRNLRLPPGQRRGAGADPILSPE